MKMKFVAVTAAAVVLGSMHSMAWSQNVAIVNGKAVPKARVDALSQQIARSGQPITPDIEKRIKDEVVTREIFMQEAQRQGLDATADFQTQMELARQNILIRELFTGYQKAHPATEEEIKAEYDQFVAANSGKEYKTRHILVETEEQAQAILAQLKKGAKFDELAKKSSKDPGSAARGGDLGWSTAGNYVAEFSQAMAKLGKGKTTDAPVKSQFGYHIIRVDDIRDAQLPKLEDIKPQVVQRLMQRKLSQYQDELRAKAKIE